MRGSDYTTIRLPALPQHPHQHFHLLQAPDQQRRALVQARGLDLQDAPAAVGGHAAGLFGEEGDGVGLVQQAQLAAGVLRRGRVQKDAASLIVASGVFSVKEALC